MGGLDEVFAGGDALDAGVVLFGVVEGFGEAFEDGFVGVVDIFAVELGDVEVHAGLGGEGAPEFFEELEVEVFDVGGGVVDLVDEEGAAAEVEGDAGEGFVHGEEAVAVAADAFAVAEGFVEGFAEDDADILDGVVVIDVEIAGGVDGEIEEGVFGEEFEHVVEEADAGVDVGGAGAVEVEGEGDVGFAGLAFSGGGACVHGVLMRKKTGGTKQKREGSDGLRTEPDFLRW